MSVNALVWLGWIVLFAFFELTGLFRRYLKWVRWKTFSETIWDWELVKGGRWQNSVRVFMVLAICVWLVFHLPFRMFT